MSEGVRGQFGEATTSLSAVSAAKSQKQVKKLIAGPGVYICDECIDLCNDIIAEEFGRADAGSSRRTPEARGDQRVSSTST